MYLFPVFPVFYYLRGYSENIFRLTPYSLELNITIVASLSTILYLYFQSVYGTFFFLPKSLMKFHDYFVTEE